MSDPLFAALEEAFGLPPQEREAFLRERLGDEPELLREALSTLRHSGSTLPIPALEAADYIGCMAGKYPLTDVLGRGAMATVYLSRQPETEREVAVKLMLVPRGVDRGSALRQRRELVSSARLDHPNVVRVLDAGFDEELEAHFAVMELVPGGRSLRGFEGSARDAARIVESICRALQHAHDRGIVHRDVKPGNVLLAPDGTPKLTDFGLALDERFAADRLTLTDEFAGTPHYMSPEQVHRRQAVIDHRTDVYSAGAVLYELLTHAPPHDGASSIEVFTKILEEVPRKLGPEVPRDLATICFQALRKDPNDRYQSALEMADDVARFLAGDPILARPEPVWRRAGRLARKHPVWTGAVLAAAVLVPTHFVERELPPDSPVLQEERSSVWRQVIQRNIERLPDEPIYHDDDEPR